MPVQTWDPSFNTQWTYTSGDLLATFTTSTSQYSNIRGVISQITGKYYWEVIATTIVGAADYAIGFVNDNHGAVGTYLGADNESVGWFGTAGIYRNGAQIASGTNYAQGDNISMGLDINLKTIQFRKNGGSWLGPYDITSVVSNNTMMYPAVDALQLTEAATAKFTQASWTYTAPAGFEPWDFVFDPTRMMFLLSP